MSPLYSIRGGKMGYDEYRVLDKPRVRLTRAAGQTIANATHTVISFDNMVWDTDGMFSAGTPTVITCKTPGLYDAKGQVIWDVSGVGNYRFAYFAVNGALPRLGLDFRPPSAGAERACNPSENLVLNKNDTLQLLCFQDSGGNLSTSSAGGTAPTASLNLCLLSTLG